MRSKANETNPQNAKSNAYMCNQTNNQPLCRLCCDPIQLRRADLGYDLCMPCGEKESKKIKRTVVPLHKSNYIEVSPESARTLLAQLTRPGRGINH